MATGSKFKFKERIPDILLESFFIVAALLLALALDEWRDDQEKIEMANKARDAIYAELADNLNKLNKKIPQHNALLETSKNYVEQQERSPSSEVDFSFEYSMALLSSAAWESAKMTQVVQSFSFNEITSFSQVYQMQSLYLENQSEIIDEVMDMGELADNQILGFAKGLSHRLEILIDINQDLSKGLESVIGGKNLATGNE